MGIWEKFKNVFTKRIEPPAAPVPATQPRIPNVELLGKPQTTRHNRPSRKKPKQEERPFEKYAENLLNKIRLGEKNLKKAQKSLKKDIKKLTEAMQDMGPKERKEARLIEKSAKEQVHPYKSKLKKEIKNFIQEEPDRSDLFENMFLSPRSSLEGYDKRVQKEQKKIEEKINKIEQKRGAIKEKIAQPERPKLEQGGQRKEKTSRNRGQRR